jgi:hypothetical protein
MEDSPLATIASLVHSSGQKTQAFYKSMNTDGTGVTDKQLVDGLARIGVSLPPHVIIQLAAPFKSPEGRLTLSGFMRMLTGK